MKARPTTRALAALLAFALAPAGAQPDAAAGTRLEGVKVTGQRNGGAKYPPRRGSDRFAEFDEQIVLQVLRALLSGEHFFLMLLQLGRDVTLGVLERLLADEVRRHLVAVSVGDFEIITEYFVVRNLQR